MARSLSLWQHIVLLKDAFFNPKTPFFAKAIIVFALIYGISPIDLLPDVLPVIGQIDDIGVIIYAVTSFLRLTKTVREDLRRKSSFETTATSTPHKEA